VNSDFFGFVSAAISGFFSGVFCSSASFDSSGFTTFLTMSFFFGFILSFFFAHDEDFDSSLEPRFE